MLCDPFCSPFMSIPTYYIINRYRCQFDSGLTTKDSGLTAASAVSGHLVGPPETLLRSEQNIELPYKAWLVDCLYMMQQLLHHEQAIAASCISNEVGVSCLPEWLGMDTKKARGVG